MRYDLSRFKSGTDHIDRTYEPAAFGAESEDFRITSPVHYDPNGARMRSG